MLHAERLLLSSAQTAVLLALIACAGSLTGCRMLDAKRGDQARGPISETSSDASQSATASAGEANSTNAPRGARAEVPARGPIPERLASLNQALPSDQVVPGTDSLQRGTVLMEQGLTVEAAKAFELAIAENPLLTPAYMRLGEIRYKEGNLEAAEQAFGQAAGLEPTNFDAQYKYAMVLHEAGKFDAAIRTYLKALALRPDDFRANSNLAAAYLQSNEPREALPYAQRAIELNPNDAASRTNLGAVYSALGQHENAITEYQQATELTDLQPKLLLNLAESYRKVNRYEEMVSTLEQVIRVEPSAAAYERLGTGHFRLGQFDESLASFEQAVSLDENYYPALNGVGVCLLRKYIQDQDDLPTRDAAVRALRRSLQIERNQPRVVQLLSQYQ
ncbi:MAG TPA: tetratricopeptide repeat protein [Phycisphaerales bacterium]|nr:tetratricopeptide repeat protein [Phycisphaerales bacterium]